MKNGFYHLQEQHKNDMPAFLSELEEIGTELSIRLSEDDPTPASVCIASFLMGFCGELAIYFNRERGLDIGVLSENGILYHVFNVFTAPTGTQYYLDARGLTDDASLFLQPFSLTTPKLTYFKSKNEAQKAFPADWFFPEDKISDAMIQWLIREYPQNYNTSSLLRSVKTPLNKQISQASGAQQPAPKNHPTRDKVR